MLNHRTETRLGFQLHEAEGPARTGLLTAAVLGRGLIDGYVVIPSMLATEVVMTPIEKLVRPARIEDADVLAELVDYAGEARQ